ncbi:Gfo/Idh/MocA family protein [Paenibacillus ginsengarvi]|uniref:Gfo/Idh/MocA family oxidoreductase n=1 Tax=Paenibacillus ginsengarvi TaxID=400777 RepID=A0A3B0CMV1_9BACL|nr:Gfo/Idh/MocA family oxidoreductase [Paenibacillus ginsengarvi]RKN86078.1 gfo/Idh/MocA family oxidoreductase [Paenibacillus ginsengarvi]
MKVAVIGCGTMGEAHAREWIRIHGVHLAGVCDPIAEKAAKVAGVCRTDAFCSFDEMMSTVKPDVVDICLPTHMHKEYTVRAAELGKHVICEKPISNTVADGLEMIDACKRHGVGLYIGHVTRFGRQYSDAHKKIKSGAIGNVGIAHTRRYGGYPGIRKEWYADRKLSGGVIMDLMIHDIDFVCWVLGDVQSVFAQAAGTDRMEYALVTLRFENGAIANLESMWGYTGPFTTRFEFAGSEGLIRSHSDESGTLTLHTATNKGHAEQVDRYINQHWELMHFIDCIRSGNQAVIAPEEALRNVEIAHAALQSIETGKRVVVSDQMIPAKHAISKEAGA